MSNSPFRFGIQASPPTSSKQWNELSKTAEDLGYDCLTIPDHMDGPMAIGPALAAAAAATTTLRIGSMVYCNDFRHPVMLAKELATIDLLSDGRLEYGLGAGWMLDDYETMALQYDRPGVRLDRLCEAVELTTGLLSGRTVEHRGTHYSTAAYQLSPQPVQLPPPLFLGGGGKRMLSIAARSADIVGINFNLNVGAFDSSVGVDGTASRTDTKLQWIQDAAGDRWDSLEIQARVHHCAVNEDLNVATAGAERLGFDHETALESPHVLVGPVAAIVDHLYRRRDRWSISYVTINATEMHEFAPVVEALRSS